MEAGEFNFDTWKQHPNMAPSAIRALTDELLTSGKKDFARDVVAAGTIENLCNMVEYLRLACDAAMEDIGDNDLDGAFQTLKVALNRTVHD